jgi:hypothetical protein
MFRSPFSFVLDLAYWLRYRNSMSNNVAMMGVI